MRWPDSGAILTGTGSVSHLSSDVVSCDICVSFLYQGEIRLHEFTYCNMLSLDSFLDSYIIIFFKVCHSVIKMHTKLIMLWLTDISNNTH